MIMVHTYEDVLLDAYASSPLLSSGSRAHPFIVQVLIWLGRAIVYSQENCLPYNYAC